MIPRGCVSAPHRALSFLLISAMTACGPAVTSSTRTPSAQLTPLAASPVVGRLAPIPKDALRGVAIRVWHPWFGVEASLFESEVADFNKTNEWGISVQPASHYSYTELYGNVASVLPSSDRPQLVVALPEYALGWDAAGYVVDLTDYVNDPQYGLSADDVRDFPAVFWSQDGAVGKHLGIPAERSARFLVYDNTWARELGFAAAPRTAAQFREQACRAHQSMSSDNDRTNDGQGGWLVNTDSMTFLSWLMAFGGGVLEGNGFHFLTPRNLTALTFVKQLYDDGCAWSASVGQDFAAAFAGRKALFATVALEELPDYSRAMAAAGNPDTWSVLTFPGPEQTGLLIYGSSYVLLKSTAEQQLASWLFVRWLVSAENQAKWVEATGLFPLRSSSMSMLGDYRKSHPQWSEAVDALPQAQMQPQLASWRQVRTMVADGFDAMFRSNTPSGRVAEILAIMDRTASDLVR
jgi:multiple sugar transport system substrate-binding protein